MTVLATQSREGELAFPPLSGLPARVAGPLAGVSCRVLSEAARRVAARTRDEADAGADREIVAAVLAAIALATDRGRACYVSELAPLASPARPYGFWTCCAPR